MTENKKPEPIIKSIPEGEPNDFGGLSKFKLEPYEFNSDPHPYRRSSFSSFPFSKNLDDPPSLDKLEPPIPLDRVLENLGRLSNQEPPEEEKWRALFEIQGNTPPSNATLIYLCERSHANKSGLLSIAQYVTEVSRTGDIILVEGFPAGVEVDKKTTEIYGMLPEGVIVRGWDNMQLFEEGNKLYNELDRINAELHSLQIPGEEKITLRIYKNGDLLPRIQQIVIKQRNQSLMRTVDALREEEANRKIFVWLGVNHIDNDSDLVQYSERFPYAVLKTKA